jgi:hypothetical protein
VTTPSFQNERIAGKLREAADILQAQRANPFRVRAWVVVYFHTDAGPEGQRTVVTDTHGPLIVRRVVRGREPECQAYHASRGEIACRKERKIE